MIDAPSLWLLQKIQQHSTKDSLWLTDENLLNSIGTSQSMSQSPRIITNRFDIAIQFKSAGFLVEFNDFNLTELATNSLDHVFYRISKEKAVVHHLINEAHRVLKPKGILWITGHKNEGIKTYIEKASHLFGCEKSVQKDGMVYSSEIKKEDLAGPYLNDDNYAVLRECIQIEDQVFLSKPGQFGWNKIDEGSEFLIDSISHLISATKINHCLDLGCGYGFLTLATHKLPIVDRTLTDNNAAALLTAHANIQKLNLKASVVPSDGGAELNSQFDLILCNPPFHQGFNVDEDLTDKFLMNTKKLLSSEGRAYFVVNQFIGLEKKAERYFQHVKLIARNKSFKVVELYKN